MSNEEANNLRLRKLLECARLKQSTALTLLNRGRRSPVTDSTFRAWLADPRSSLFRPLSDEELASCQRAFASDLLDQHSSED